MNLSRLQQRELWLVPPHHLIPSCRPSASSKRFLAAANDRDFAVFGDERSATARPIETPAFAPPTAPLPQIPNDQPTSFANGRYQVKRLLGEGGKKRVYLAQDTTWTGK